MHIWKIYNATWCSFCILVVYYCSIAFFGGSDRKESASKAGDPGCNPGLVLPFIALFETVISHLIQRMGINAW